jgi:hypothetical protein
MINIEEKIPVLNVLRVYVWGPSGTLVKQQGSLELIWGTKGPLIKA